MKKHSLRWIFICLGLAFFWAEAGEKVGFEKTPGWVIRRPHTPVHYIGIASVEKNRCQKSCHEEARKKALAALAGEITSDIHVQSRSQTNENTLGNLPGQQSYSSQYTSAIKSESHAWLDGYEHVSSWESSTQYWVYYRLDKQVYVSKRQALLDQRDSLAAQLDNLEKNLSKSVSVFTWLKNCNTVLSMYTETSLRLKIDAPVEPGCLKRLGWIRPIKVFVDLPVVTNELSPELKELPTNILSLLGPGFSLSPTPSKADWTWQLRWQHEALGCYLGICYAYVHVHMKANSGDTINLISGSFSVKGGGLDSAGAKRDAEKKIGSRAREEMLSLIQ